MKISYLSKPVVDLDSCINVVFDKAPTAEKIAELKTIANVSRPMVLTVGYDFFPSSTGELDLSYLANLPSLQSLSLTYVAGLRSLDFLESLPSLRFLRIDPTKTSKLSLRPIRFLRSLQALKLDKQGTDIDVISELPELQYLSIQSSPLKNLDCLTRSSSLCALRIGLGSFKDLSFLAGTKLRYLELWQVRGLLTQDLEPVVKAPRLEALTLDTLGQVTALPHLEQLRRLQMREMNGLTDLHTLASAKKLEDLIIEGADKLAPDSITQLKNLSSLKSVSIRLGSQRKNQTVAEMFKLPPTVPIYDFEFA
jgi:hypothetical protein